ncbi:MAG: hypothetical protein QOG17_2062 [Gammaproteobacteria bacterium]|nr:hypothetical protein [Gammaproteobacteria bacterium]
MLDQDQIVINCGKGDDRKGDHGKRNCGKRNYGKRNYGSATTAARLRLRPLRALPGTRAE